MVVLWFLYTTVLKGDDVMVSITLKNIPNELHRELRKQAQQHHRSLNSEILACLEKNAHSPVVNVDSFLRDVRSIRKNIKGNLTEKNLRATKNQGRP